MKRSLMKFAVVLTIVVVVELQSYCVVWWKDSTPPCSRTYCRRVSSR